MGIGFCLLKILGRYYSGIWGRLEYFIDGAAHAGSVERRVPVRNGNHILMGTVTLAPPRVLLVLENPRNLLSGKAALLQEPHLPAALPEVPGQVRAELFFSHLPDPLLPLIIKGLDTQVDETGINTPLPQFGMNFLRP